MKQPHNEVILDSVADGVFTVDRHWHITTFNRAAEQITGISRSEAIGRKCADVFQASVCPNACVLRQTLETGTSLVNRRIEIRNREGRRIPVTVSTAVLRDEDGEVIGGVETFRDLSQIESLRADLRRQYSFGDIISKNHEIHRILDILPDVAESDCTVMVEGPSGSGKELFAHAIHSLSDRRQRSYVAVNCGALPDSLLESELFGYVPGAFTDAKTDRMGRFARAEGGTLFLDEIGDISPAMQIKLLRVLQEREYEPLGSNRAVKADVRVIAATNLDLNQLVADGRFRRDLYYRLNVVRIPLPPLTRRREDIPLLTDHFVARFVARTGKDIHGLDPAALDILMRHDFPGNVRELQNIIEHAFVLCRGGWILPAHLPEALCDGAAERTTATQDPLAEAEAQAILDALRRHRGNRRRTAEELQIDKSTLWRKMKRYGMHFPVGRSEH